MEGRAPETNDKSLLTSPCDGTVYSISKVKDINHMLIVKKFKYSLNDFLFGGNENFIGDLNEFMTKENVYQVTIYLSPGDCHRYFSPGDIYVEKRIHTLGFLEPVRPKYVFKHPKVFKTNERVTLKCKLQGDKDNLLYVSFVGALNVGSIKLNFDDLFTTNQKLV